MNEKSRVLIIGAYGRIGKEIYKIFNVESNKNSFDIFGTFHNNPVNEFEKIDITNIDSVKNVINKIKPNIIIHSAASKFVDISEKFASETVDTNIVGSKNLILSSRKYKCNKFIAISSDKASPPFKNLYGLSKATMEKILININSDKKQDLNIVRFGNLAWSTGSVLNQWEEMNKQNKIIKTTGPEMTRFFYDIDKAIKLIDYLIRDKRKLNNKVILPSMKSLVIKDLLLEFCKINKAKWKKTKKRKMDKNYETLIPNQQSFKIKDIKNGIGKIFIINLNDKIKSSQKEINSKNSKIFSTRELKKIVINKPKFI